MPPGSALTRCRRVRPLPPLPMFAQPNLGRWWPSHAVVHGVLTAKQGHVDARLHVPAHLQAPCHVILGITESPRTPTRTSGSTTA